MTDTHAHAERNALAEETSPYLLQHASNPVDWHPWGAAAFAAARERDVPLLLSIGYSACHWCHVMAHESFENESIAAQMNNAFVNVKVDREERPDVDRIYQIAHQILTQQPGGWPLTVFVDPYTQRPFFSATYFPAEPRYGMPGFPEVLQRVERVWQERRAELDQQGEKLQEIFDALNAPPSAETDLPGTQALQQARDALAASFDAAWGGFGEAPKFPMSANLERLMRHWAYAGRRGEHDREALEMAQTTLTRMARGGIHDHIGGGFCRYATDREWVVPHFEKMLYDNGPLLERYADALTVVADPLFEGTVIDTVEWMLREMRSPEGAFYASLDADSEHEEGRFYVWSRAEVQRLLHEQEYLVVETLFGLDKPANFHGHWILWRRDAWHAVVERLGLEREQADAHLASACRKLFAARATRTHPGRDDKVLTAWNALAIAGLARAARVLERSDWTEAALRALDFIRQRLWINGRLKAIWKDGEARHAGYLDDHAYLLVTLLEVLELRWRDTDARFAVALADALLQHFEDDAAGGFFFTAHDHEALLHRPKPAMDESTPAGNGMAARGLARLGHLLGEQRYIDAAARTLRWASSTIERAPQAHATLLAVAEDLLQPPEQVIIRGPEAERWAARLRQRYVPWRSVFALPGTIPPADGATEPLLPTYLEEQTAAGETRAWVCTHLSCSLPITSAQALEEALGGSNVVSLR